MPYCTAADVQVPAGGSTRLLQMADTENAGSLSAPSVQATISAAIAEADSLIDRYSQNRRQVPFNPVPEAVKRFSAAEAAYYLMRDRGMATEHAKQEHDDRMLVLRDIAKGLATWGVDPVSTPSTTQAIAETGDRSNFSDFSTDDEINAENLKGFA